MERSVDRGLTWARLSTLDHHRHALARLPGMNEFSTNYAAASSTNGSPAGSCRRGRSLAVRASAARRQRGIR